MFIKSVTSYTFFSLVETNLSFWWDLEKFSQKSVPSHMFLRCGNQLEFLMGLGKIFTKKCAQSHVSSLWRLSKVFEGTWKVSTKRCDQLHIFFAVQTILSFWMGLRKLSTKRCGQLHLFGSADYLKVLEVTRFFAVETILRFWGDLESFDQKGVTSYTFFSQCRLS